MKYPYTLYPGLQVTPGSIIRARFYYNTLMSAKTPKISRTWFQNTFDSLYPILYAHRTIEAARPETLFSIKQTGLKAGDCVLDLCCGGGRHMVHLIETTQHVTGLDYSPHLLEIARQTAGPAIPLIRGDMRKLPFVEKFDVVMNYFTSFGYFHHQAENQQVMHEMVKALKPGGRLFIDYMNKEHAIQNLESETRRVSEGFNVIERRWIENDESRINKATIISQGDDEIKHSGESVQLYTESEFTEMIEKAGIMIDSIFGDYTEAALSPELPRMIVIGRKT